MFALEDLFGPRRPTQQYQRHPSPYVNSPFFQPYYHNGRCGPFFRDYEEEDPSWRQRQLQKAREEAERKRREEEYLRRLRMQQQAQEQEEDEEEEAEEEDEELVEESDEDENAEEEPMTPWEQQRRQLLLNQLQQRKRQEEERRKEQVRMEEMRRKMEEAKINEHKRRMIEEEQRRKLIKEREMQRLEEERKREAELRRKMEEQKKLIEAERKRREEARLKMEQERKVKEEEMRKKIEEQKKRREEEARLRAEAAATLIQRNFRGYTIRKRNPLEPLRKIRAVEERVETNRRRWQGLLVAKAEALIAATERMTDDIGNDHERDKAKRELMTCILAFEEEMVKHLLSLDSIQTGGLTEVRERRRGVALRVQGILAEVDKVKKWILAATTTTDNNASPSSTSMEVEEPAAVDSLFVQTLFCLLEQAYRSPEK